MTERNYFQEWLNSRPSDNDLFEPVGDVEKLIYLGRCLAEEPIGDYHDLPIMVGAYNRLHRSDSLMLTTAAMTGESACPDSTAWLMRFPEKVQMGTSEHFELRQVRQCNFDQPNCESGDMYYFLFAYLIEKRTGVCHLMAEDPNGLDNYQALCREVSCLVEC